MNSQPYNTCPECGSKLFHPGLSGWGERPREPLDHTQDGSPGVSPHQRQDFVCPNPDCPAQVRRALVHWCSPEAMDIPGGDATFVAKLVAKGLVRDVAEFYRVKVKELAALEGMTKESAQQFFDAITASMKREAWRVLFGLGIPGVTTAGAQSVCRHFGTLDAVFACGARRLMEADGIDAATAQAIAAWHGDSINRKLVNRLQKAGVNFKVFRRDSKVGVTVAEAGRWSG